MRLRGVCRISTLVMLFATAFAQVITAPAAPRTPAPEEQITFAQDYLNKRLSLWRGILHLDDWNISLEVSPRSGLRGGTLGNIHWDDAKKSARIRVLQPSDYKVPFYSALEDMEFTLVHELVHLELAALPRTDESRPEEEHAVDRMATALLKLESSAARPPSFTP